MTTRQTRFQPGQTGAVMVIGLIFLLVLTLLGVAALGGNSLEEHMAGNTRDVNLALQAAEAALRDGEADVQANLSPEAAFSATCAGGLCATRADSTPWWQANPTWRSYGSVTGVPALPGVTNPPRYIIEQPSSLPTQSLAIGAKPSATGWGYRITAMGLGNRGETRVVLQSVYVMR